MIKTREQQKRENTKQIETGFANDAIVGELERINDAITELKSDMQMMCMRMVEMCDHIKMISKPDAPEVEVTMTETNELLKALLAEEQKPEEPIEIKLELE